MVARKPDLRIIHDDTDFVIVDKPAGLLSVPVSPGTAVNLFDQVASHFDSDNVRIGSVHRIDRYTSGLMIFSKNDRAHQHLLGQFSDHTARRCYLAVVRGIIQEDEGELNHHLKLIKEGFRNIVVSPEEEGATPARLTYHVKERFVDTTLVAVCLDTGLKNQIRVQFEHIGHQLVGDQHYAPEEEGEPLINRQALHAYQLEFTHPRKRKTAQYEAKIPADILRLIEKFRWKKESHSK